mmetsp:Transcript_22087/g.57543  ORF Transcript_22087/g.57543 Transcript_22087/m.57543 type:complete len:234 (+) Transcript_22087:157-858(+)
MHALHESHPYPLVRRRNHFLVEPEEGEVAHRGKGAQLVRVVRGAAIRHHVRAAAARAVAADAAEGAVHPAQPAAAAGWCVLAHHHGGRGGCGVVATRVADDAVQRGGVHTAGAEARERVLTRQGDVHLAGGAPHLVQQALGAAERAAGVLCVAHLHARQRQARAVLRAQLDERCVAVVVGGIVVARRQLRRMALGAVVPVDAGDLERHRQVRLQLGRTVCDAARTVNVHPIDR